MRILTIVLAHPSTKNYCDGNSSRGYRWFSVDSILENSFLDINQSQMKKLK